jgi:signal transduction histidine kinase
LRFLVLGLALTLAGDVLFALSVGDGTNGDRLLNTVLLLGVVLIGVAGLDPSMRSLTEEATAATEQTGRVRLLVLAGVCVIPPAVITFQYARGETLHLAAALTAVIIISALVAARFTVMTETVRAAARRERALRSYAAELLGATSRDELFSAAQRTAALLVDHGVVRLAVGSAAAERATDGAFVAPVVAGGARVADLVAEGSPATLRAVKDSLATVAAQLALALERDQLLTVEREAAEALAVQNERLRELDAMKDRFVSTVSHEVRTPLTSMVGYLEILRDGEAGALNAEQEHFLEIVDRNCRRLNDLIGDILISARLESGRVALQAKSIDLVGLAARQVESIRAAARARAVEVAFEGAGDVAVVTGDERLLGQLLDNLISNAVKFTPAGGTVTVTVEADAATVRVSVSDTGVGIPPGELASLFDRFFRASTADTVAGTGLGLSIAKSIAEAHGGTITVDSTLGVGTTFAIELPLDTRRASPAGDAATEAA